MPVKSGTFGTFGTFASVYAGNHRFEAKVQSGTFGVPTGTFGTFARLPSAIKGKKWHFSPLPEGFHVLSSRFWRFSRSTRG